MKILILGGTGAMGRAMMKYLGNNEKYDVCVTTRSIRTNTYDNIKFIQGNAKDISFLNKVLSDEFDIIVDFMNYTIDEFKIRKTILLNNCKQYFFISSSRVYANNNPITETSKRLLDSVNDKKYISTKEYAISKALSENELFSTKKRNWTIIRPYITYNQNRLQFCAFEKEQWLYRLLKNHSVIVPQDIIDHITTLTSGEDVAIGIISLFGNENSFGEVINITNNEFLNWSDVLDIYLSAIKKTIEITPKICSIDDSLVFSQVLNNHYQVIYDRRYDRIFDNQKYRLFTSNLASVNTKEGLEYCITQFLSNHPFEFSQINWRYEGIADSISNEKYSFKEFNGIKNMIIYYIWRFFPFKNVLGCIYQFENKIKKAVKELLLKAGIR